MSLAGPGREDEGGGGAERGAALGRGRRAGRGIRGPIRAGQGIKEADE